VAQLDEAAIAKLKAEHGDVAVANFPDGSQFVFRRPKRAEYDLWQDSKDRDVSRSTSARQLAQACLLTPGYGELLAALEQWAGALLCSDGILDALVGMAGGIGGVVTVKKA
jgi:hypothetical protein